VTTVAHCKIAEINVFRAFSKMAYVLKKYFHNSEMLLNALNLIYCKFNIIQRNFIEDICNLLKEAL